MVTWNYTTCAIGWKIMGSMNKGTLKFLMGLFLKGSFGQGFVGVVLGCKGGGVKKKRRRKQGSTGKTSQDKPTQAKGSLRGQMTCSESGWCLAEAVDVSLGDHVKVWISLEVPSQEE